MTDLHDIGRFMFDDARERGDKARLAAFLHEHGAASFSRDPHIGGHVTGSAFVLSPDKRAVLMTHHAKLDRWLQLGGHCDGICDVRFVAQKEAYEESGLSHISFLSPDVFDLDIHSIPATSREPEHLHFDVRFLMQADDWEVQLTAESKALKWISLADLEIYTRDISVLRLRDKVVERDVGSRSQSGENDI
ncbi:NUDIX hydrolase [uncultured Pelagimonas sp.]|uniref:NUDIX hydrolase n=1 Tax=uncultured Pelagimonas sp. TaxID=1618102 RepID=UPI002612DC03|nr:NUDIX hydrolase [uncultured Pelagimonas sp.]